LLIATSSIGVLSYLSGRASRRDTDLFAAAGIIAGVSSAITAWQSESGADRKINRYTNAAQALKNHLLWWHGLTPVDQNSQVNINRLVTTSEDIKLSEVNAWADVRRLLHACSLLWHHLTVTSIATCITTGSVFGRRAAARRPGQKARPRARVLRKRPKTLCSQLRVARANDTRKKKIVL
jgi:hypothetical protein